MTYEDYLDGKFVDNDLFYLEDKELARQLAEHGYHTRSKTISQMICLREHNLKKRKSI